MEDGKACEEELECHCECCVLECGWYSGVRDVIQYLETYFTRRGIRFYICLYMSVVVNHVDVDYEKKSRGI